MYLFMTGEASCSCEKFKSVLHVEKAVKKAINNKQYDILLDKWYCLAIIMDSDFFSERIQYSPKKRSMDFRLKIDYEKFNNGSPITRCKLVVGILLRSLDILEQKGAGTAGIQKLRDDVVAVAKKNKWYPPIFTLPEKKDKKTSVKSEETTPRFRKPFTIQLYKREADKMLYWEAWEQKDGSYLVHWGPVGRKGKIQIVDERTTEMSRQIVDQLIVEMKSQGFRPWGNKRYSILLIEYKINDMGTTKDLNKRFALENFMNKNLGWYGLGFCDGGSTGSGTMEVCCFVVDFKAAKSAIQKLLRGTKFQDYTRIYDENA